MFLVAGEFACSLTFASGTFISLLSQLHAVEVLKDARLAAERLEAIISEREQKIQFDFSRIVDVRERVRFPSGQAIVCSQITPLVGGPRATIPR